MRDEIATYLNWTSNVAPLGENGLCLQRPAGLPSAAVKSINC